MNRTTPRRFAIFSIILLALAALWIYESIPDNGVALTGKIPAPREGFAAPDFTLQNLTGESTRLSQLRGKVVVLNLWASWCMPCQAEMPAMQKAHEAFAGSPVIILAVNMTAQDDPDRAAQFAAEKNLSFPILLDPEGEVARKYELRALPTTFFIDPDGIIRKVIAGGPLPEALFRSEVEQILKGGS